VRKNQIIQIPSLMQQSEKTEFDDLISALRTGDVFGENMDKFRRNRSTKALHGHGARNSPPRVDRMDSFLRERTTSNHAEAVRQYSREK
jgi:hypothetical protein